MIHLRNLRKAALFVCLCLCQPAGAAEFKKSSTKAGRPDFIEVVGDLALGDEKKFVDVAISSADAVVVFHSRGGNLFAGMEIGRAIRLKGFSTLVPDKMLCASACALAWLGGRVRLMSDTGRVGFHAAYTDENGEANVSSAGNAIVGAYLNQLGLPTSAIVYITDSPPNGMQWLSFADAQRVSIDVKLLSPPRPQDGSSKAEVAPSAPISNPPSKVSRSNAPSSTTSDQPLYQLDKSESTVVSISNLYLDRNCSSEKTVGRITKREFAKDGLTLNGVVIEEPDGNRTYVNVIIR